MDSLPDVYDALREEAEDGLSEAAYGPNADEAGRVYEGLVDAFHGLAICDLLLDYDPDAFRRHLVYAAGARRQFLQVCLRDNAAPLERAISRTDALFCALAARDTVMTGELVRLGPPTWVPDGEYEDDFCYHALLSHIAAPERSSALPSPTDLLERFSGVLDGGATPQLEICRSLVANDSEGFRAAFGDLLEEREAWPQEVYSFRRDQPLFLVARYVFVEGLALLALAAARDWSMPDEYAFCPQLGRLAPASPMPADLFLDVVPLLRESRRQRGLAT